MNEPAPGPGLCNQAGARTFFRVGGVVLVPLGVAVLVWGMSKVFGYDGYDAPPARYLVAFLSGLPIIGLGLIALNLGFLGTAARYGAGETMPVVRDGAGYLTDGQGLLGVGRTVEERPQVTTATGPYCRACGGRNDDDAKFCDGCGTDLT